MLIPGVDVYLEKSDNPNRKTKYDLVKVVKGNCLVNMDSQAPNQVVGEWLREKQLYKDPTLVVSEKTYGNSRFDFYVEGDGKKAWIEVKGVTLERDGAALFPDAPSERAVKHVEHLIKAREEGYEAYIILVIQMRYVKYFTPNRETHPQFAEVLEKAEKAGVQIMAFDCRVTEDEVSINQPVEVRL